METPPLPLLFYAIQYIKTAGLQHQSYSKLDGQLIHGIRSPFYCLNHPNRPGAPNATRRHSPPDLPPQPISIQTERSTVCLLRFSTIFVLTLSPDELCTTHIHHAIHSHKIEFIAGFRRLRCSSRLFLATRIIFLTSPTYRTWCCIMLLLFAARLTEFILTVRQIC
jgi:hypothetical protein